MKIKFVIIQLFFFLNIKFAIGVDNPKPNIVFIMADDLGWTDLPCYGNKFNEAPHIDQLAQKGVIFTNAYSAGAVSSPTRASIMSGQYPARVGIIDFIVGHWRTYEKMMVPVNRTQYLPDEIITIAETLKGAGYKTGYYGKWHLGLLDEHHPMKQGFDDAKIANGKFYNVEFKPKASGEQKNRFNESITDFGVQFMEQNKNQPFFLFLSHYDVHVQLDADDYLIQKYLKKPKVEGYPSNAVYAAMIEHLDQSVGRIQRKLKDLGIDKNTLIIFFSDNGGLNMRYDKAPLIADNKQHYYKNDSLLFIASSNKPLRDEKGSLYEGGIRVPLIISWPQKIEGAKKSEMPITSVDFYPALSRLSDAHLPDDQIFDGVDFISDLIEEKENSDRAIFWHYPVYHHSVPASAVRKGDWKLIEFLDDNHVELYNLKSDIGESKDLSHEITEKTHELKKLLSEWRTKVSAPMPLPNPAFDPQRRYEWGKHPHLFNMKKYKLRE